MALNLRQVLCGNGPSLPIFRCRDNPREIDYDVTMQHAELCLQDAGYGVGCTGVDFVKLCGYTAMAEQMLKKQQIEIYRKLIPRLRSCGFRLPILFNISTNEPDVAEKLAEGGLESGGDIAVATPTYNTPVSTKDILLPVRSRFPDLNIILHVARHFESMTAEKVLKLAKEGLINGVIWNFQKHSLRELMELIHDPELPKDFVFGTDTENYMMILTSAGGRFCVSRSANLWPMLTGILSGLHHNVRSNSFLPAIKELNRLYDLIDTIEDGSPRTILYALSMINPDIYGKEPVLPPGVNPLEPKQFKELSELLERYELSCNEPNYNFQEQELAQG